MLRGACHLTRGTDLVQVQVRSRIVCESTAEKSGFGKGWKFCIAEERRLKMGQTRLSVPPGVRTEGPFDFDF